MRTLQAAQGSCVNIQYILYNVKQSKLGGGLINSCTLYTLSGVITIHALHCGESCVTNDKCTIICICHMFT